MQARAHDAASSPIAALLADSCPHARRCARAAVRSAGYTRIFEAGDGAEAVSLLGAMSPTLLLLDWDLPLIGAAEVIELAKGARSREDGPVQVVLTMTHPVRSAVERAVGLGVRGIVAKPYPTRVLRSHLPDCSLG